MTSEPLLGEGLYKSYGAIRAVHGISLSIQQSKALCIQGRSGSGKTTLLKILALVSKPDRGNLLIDGINSVEASDSILTKLRKRIGFSFQEPLLLPYLSAIQNLSLVVSQITHRKHSDLESEGTKLLSRIGLAERLDHFPSKLSVGEKKRVDLARAIMKHPVVLIADEPFANLDPETSRKVIEVLKDYMRAGGAVVYSSTEPSHSKMADDLLKL